MRDARIPHVPRRFPQPDGMHTPPGSRNPEVVLSSASADAAAYEWQRPLARNDHCPDAPTGRMAATTSPPAKHMRGDIRLLRAIGAVLVGIFLAQAVHAASRVPEIKTVYRVARANHDFSRIAIARSGTVWVLNAVAGGKYHALYAFAPSGRLIGKYPATWNPMTAAATCSPQPGARSAEALQAVGAAFMQCVSALQQTGNISGPTGMAIDHAGHIWVVSVGDKQASELFELSPDGTILGKPTSAGIGARDLAIAPNGDLWVATGATPKVDTDVPPPRTGSQSAIDRLWGGNPELRVYSSSGVLVGKVKYIEFAVTQSPTTILKRAGIWGVVHNLVFAPTGNFTNISVTRFTKHGEHRCRQCLAVGAPTTEVRLLRDYDLSGEPWDCESTVPGAIGSGGGSGSRYAAFAPDGLLWRAWDAGLFAVDLKRGVIKRELCGKKLQMINRFAISQDGSLWAYAPMLHGVADIEPDGSIRRSFPGVKARDLAIDQHGDVWAVSAGRVVEIIGAARKPQYFPYYTFTTPFAPQWP